MTCQQQIYILYVLLFFSGFCACISPNSHIEYDSARGRHKNKYEFSLEFKTEKDNGTLFYVADGNHNHYVALYMQNGKIRYDFNCGAGPARLESDKTYNTGEWHTVQFTRNHAEGKLFVDNQLVAEGKSSGHTRPLIINPPFYVGGIPQDIISDVTSNLGQSEQFIGCIRNVTMNNKIMENPRLMDIHTCSNNLEPGVFFGVSDGYIRVFERFKVGVHINIQFDIKPRNTTGVLMSVFGRNHYLILQMVDGVIRFTVDSGKGPIESAFKPPHEHYFCDGNWHSIQAIKSKNVVSLSVDKTFAEAGVGTISVTETRGGLFVGGHQYLKRLKGFTTRSSYVGCMRNIIINSKPVDVKPGQATGDVRVGVCPTN